MKKIIFVYFVILCVILGFSWERSRSIQNENETLQVTVGKLQEQSERLSTEVENLKNEQAELEYVLSKSPTWKSIGVHELSFYTTAPDEGSGTGITASGSVATVGRTVAHNNLPFGTKIMIDGHIYVVEDTGGSLMDRRFDILVNTKEEAFSNGIQYKEVYVLQEE